MKQFFFALAALTVSATYAQDAESTGLAKGDIFMGGTVNFTSSKWTSENYKENSFAIAPNIGFMVTDKIAIGGELGYAKATAEELPGAPESEVSAFSVGVFGRYYFTPASKFSLFGELGFQYATVDTGADDNMNVIGVAAAPGLQYFVSDHFGLMAKWGVLGYTSAKVDAPGAEASTEFEFGVDLNNIDFGIFYKF